LPGIEAQLAALHLLDLAPDAISIAQRDHVGIGRGERAGGCARPGQDELTPRGGAARG
jgi:hypothetical protein